MRKTEHRRSSLTGFTIVELLVVIVIISLLAGISIVAYNNVQRSAQVLVVQNDLQNIVQAVTLYESEHGSYPNMIQINSPQGWAVLEDMGEILRSAGLFEETRTLNPEKSFRFCPTPDQSDYVVVAYRPIMPFSSSSQASAHVGAEVYFVTSEGKLGVTSFLWDSSINNLGWNLCNSVDSKYAPKPVPPSTNWITSWSHDMPTYLPRT